MRRKLVDIIGPAAYKVSIHTFHGFAARIIEQYPDYFPRIIGSTIITEAEQIRIVEEVIRSKQVKLLRPYGDQTRALVLDVVGAGRHHDLASLVDLTDRPIRIKEGQTLEEADVAFDLEEELLGTVEPIDLEVEHYRGPTEAVEFDPLARKSKRVWLTTKTGARFLKSGESHFVFLVPTTMPDAEAGTFDLCWCTKSAYAEGRRCGYDFTVDGEVVEHRGVELGYAMSWGERVVDEAMAESMDDFGTKRQSWRSKPVSRKALARAAALGLHYPEPIDDVDYSPVKAGKVADDIASAEASRRIDPIVRAILKGQG